jgi:hypothetical protein
LWHALRTSSRDFKWVFSKQRLSSALLVLLENRSAEILVLSN